MRRLLPVLLLVLLGTTTAARADDVSTAALALRTAPVYQAPGVDVVDVAALGSELAGRDPRVLLAVLPASSAASDAEAHDLATAIGAVVGDPAAVVLVVTANQHFGAAEGHAAAARGVDAVGALRAELASGGTHGFTQDGLTALVTSFTERVVNQASTGGTAAAPAPRSTGRSPWLVGGLVVLGVAVAGWVAWSGRQRRTRLNEGLRAEVEQLYERLGSDVATLDPADDKVAKQALADAAERFTACGAQLAEADAPAELAAARRTAVEGLTAARAARAALGLDPGPALPVVPGDGPQLTSTQPVAVGGESFEGSPRYEPGRPHYFGGGVVGGQQVPGGWYPTPFWDLGAALTGEGDR